MTANPLGYEVWAGTGDATDVVEYHCPVDGLVAATRRGAQHRFTPPTRCPVCDAPLRVEVAPCVRAGNDRG